MTDKIPPALEFARADLELECPPTAIPIGDAVRQLRRRSRLIDWLLTVLIVATPLAILGGAVALILLTSTTEDVGRRADAVVGSNRKVADSNAELVARLDELEDTNAKLEDLIVSFRALALATTPEERAAARAAIERADVGSAPSTRTTSGTASSSASPSTTSTSTTAAPTSSTSTPPPSSTTTTPPPTTTTTRPAICVPLVGCVSTQRRTTR